MWREAALRLAASALPDARGRCRVWASARPTLRGKVETAGARVRTPKDSQSSRPVFSKARKVRSREHYKFAGRLHGRVASTGPPSRARR